MGGVVKKFFYTFSLVICLVLGQTQAFALSDKVYKELSTFSKILELIDKMYVENVDEKKAIQGAINGMLMSLDPHTIYLPAEVYKTFSSDTRGRFGGIGIEVSIKDGVLTVISPIQGTPAWNAGIKSGDKILGINGKSTKNITLGEAVHRMRGHIGKKLSITIWRAGKTRVVTLTRRLIKVPGIRVEDLGQGFALFRITSFQEGIAKQLKKEIQNFQNTHGNIKGIILDLRDNPGGLLSEAVKISDYFLKKGVIVSTKGRNRKADVKKARSKGTLPDIPMVVLINRGSASASEIVAAALKENGRAKLLGTKSFGKGSVQTIVNLDNGDALKITIAYYFTPKDRLIDGKGIDPDILLDTKAFKKKKGIKGKDQETKIKITRDEFNKFQKDEALTYLKRISR